MSCEFSTYSISVIKAFRLLSEEQFFKDILKENIEIWCDTGSHFRSAEILHYTMIELPQNNCSVSINYFVEKHGKYF